MIWLTASVLVNSLEIYAVLADLNMDVDNELPDGHGGEVDLEQSLLQQFSCLGTTDKEELVRQLQKFLGSQLNESTASFFLDMNNWLVQSNIYMHTYTKWQWVCECVR